MTTWSLLFWSVMMLLGFALSALYSGMETGSYTLNRIRLQIRDHQHLRSARKLHKLFANPTLLLSTLLIGNNIANYLGTASLAVILDKQGLGDWQAMLLNVLIVTPVLFVLGETLPKDLFAAYADRWMYRLSWVLTLSRRLFTVTLLIPLVNLFTLMVMRVLGQSQPAPPFHPRRQVETLVREGAGYGVISDEQSALVERVLDLAELRVRRQMRPWKDVVHVKKDATVSSVWQLADRTSHNRLPVVDDAGRVCGVLNVLDVLMHDRATCPPIAELMQPVYQLQQDTPLRKALHQVRQWQTRLAVVVDEDGRPVGIVSIKDLIETITGQLGSW